jgi:hypothetical protein
LALYERHNLLAFHLFDATHNPLCVAQEYLGVKEGEFLVASEVNSGR